MDIKKQDKMLAKGTMLPLMEAFYSIQGEGYFKGSAAYFIRIGGCDVGCHWCDVKESWNPKLHPPTIVDEIIKTAHKFSDTIVVTGGEPLDVEYEPPYTGFEITGYENAYRNLGCL